MKRFLALILSLSMALALAACGGGNQPAAEPDSTGSAAETTSGNTAEPAAEGSTELNIYMWQQYISEQLVADFEEANNCTVNISYMSDNADAVTRLTAGGGDQYDLIMTCDAYMESLIAGGYVEKLDKSLIPNSENINEAYWSSPDYSIPYLGNYIYVVYNTETCPIEITCYNDLLDPALKGQITSIDGARNLFPMALVALGYDPNSENEEEIAEAYEWLVKYNENVVAYGNAEQNLTNGTASVAFTYDGNASWAMAEMGEDNPLVVAPFTDDAVQLGFDMYVIPTGAKHTDLAYKFLDYICTPEVMAQNLAEFPYFCPNDAAVELAPESYRNDPSKDFDYKDNVFFQEDVGEALTVYNDYYQMLKVGE